LTSHSAARHVHSCIRAHATQRARALNTFNHVSLLKGK
jgi:hypothetical protein